VIVAKKTKLEAARGALGWSQSELALRSEVSRTRINAIETGGDSLKAATAKKICDALGRSFDELFEIAERTG